MEMFSFWLNYHNWLHWKLGSVEIRKVIESCLRLTWITDKLDLVVADRVTFLQIVYDLKVLDVRFFKNCVSNLEV